MKTVLVILVAAGLLAAGPALAQRVVAATELGNNPAAFHNSTIKVADVVVDGGRLKPAAMLARVEEAVRDYLSGKGEGAVVAEGERDA